MNIITRLKNSIQNMIKIGIITLAGDDSEDYNRTQVSYLGKTKKVTVIMPYGIDANIPKDSLLILFNIMGQEENMVAFGNDQSIRFKNLEEGEVVVGNPKTGSKVYFKANGDIEIVSSTTIVNINGIDFNTHTHIGNLGAPTGVPI